MSSLRAQEHNYQDELDWHPINEPTAAEGRLDDAEIDSLFTLLSCD